MAISRRLHQALVQAERGHHDLVAAEAWLQLAKVVGYHQSRWDEGLRDVRQAEAKSARMGGTDALEAEVAGTFGVILSERGDFERAAESFARALEISAKVHGAESMPVARLLAGQGVVLREMERFDEARVTFERTIAMYAKVVGPEHPRVARPLFNLGESYRRMGRLDEARPLIERSLAIMEHDDRAHPFVTYPLTALGELALDQGRVSDALVILERAMALRETVEGGNPRDIADTRFALARALWEKGSKTRALALARESRAVYAKSGHAGAKPLARVDGWLASR